jgi:hypothetical protein
MTAARDEACDIYFRLAAGAVCDDARITELRKVGAS